jgi:hypothetical protein
LRIVIDPDNQSVIVYTDIEYYILTHGIGTGERCPNLSELSPFGLSYYLVPSIEWALRIAMLDAEVVQLPRTCNIHVRGPLEESF